MQVVLIINSLIEILPYPWEFFVFSDLIIDVISLVEKVFKTKDKEGWT